MSCVFLVFFCLVFLNGYVERLPCTHGTRSTHPFIYFSSILLSIHSPIIIIIGISMPNDSINQSINQSIIWSISWSMDKGQQGHAWLMIEFFLFIKLLTSDNSFKPGIWRNLVQLVQFMSPVAMGDWAVRDLVSAEIWSTLPPDDDSREWCSDAWHSHCLIVDERNWGLVYVLIGLWSDNSRQNTQSVWSFPCYF